MPNSNGRVYSETRNGVKYGVSINDVATVLGVRLSRVAGKNHVRTLCRSDKVNMWAKCKPISVLNRFTSLNYAQGEQVTNYHCGLSVLYGSSFNNFKAAVVEHLNDNDYKNNNVFVGVKYERPTGGSYPLRLHDFDGYNHRAILDYTIDNGNSGGDGLPISSLYSSNINIDLRGSSPTDESLPDDSLRLSYYENFMSGGSQIVARQDLHVLDVIKWQLTNGVVLTNLRRGMLIMRADDLTTFKWTSDKLLWSDANWREAFGASGVGNTVWCIEFYTDVNYAGGSENRTGSFFCIPQFCYQTKCIVDANFAGSYPATTPSNKIEVFYHCDAAISTFKELFIDLEICYDGSTWDRVQTITVKDTSTTNVQGVYENVYLIDSTNDGKQMRVKIYGKLANANITSQFYISEDYTINMM